MESVALDLISNVGFPIAVSVGLFFQMTKANDTYLKMVKEFQEIINNNTKSIDLLNSTVERLRNDMSYRKGENE